MAGLETNRPAKWMEGTGPYSDIVISSRIRLARNIHDLPFPHLVMESQFADILERLKPFVTNRTARSPAHRFIMHRLRICRLWTARCWSRSI